MVGTKRQLASSSRFAVDCSGWENSREGSASWGHRTTANRRQVLHSRSAVWSKPTVCGGFFGIFSVFGSPAQSMGPGGNLVFTSGQRKPKWPVECAWAKGRDELPAGPRRRVLLRVILENEIWGLRTPPASDRIFAFARVDPTQTPPCRVERLIFELK